MRKMKKHYPNMHFDFHAHNDYDLAVSNVLAAVLSGAKGLHTTINGLGDARASSSFKCAGYSERPLQCSDQY